MKITWLYLRLIPISWFSFIFSSIICIIAAPILPFFASSEGWLPRWLWWFQTDDNSLDGDYGWIHEHMQWRYKFPHSIATYLGRVGWLLRNRGYGLSTNQGKRLDPSKETVLFGLDNVSDNPYTPGLKYQYQGNMFELYAVHPTIFGSDKCVRFRWGYKMGQRANVATDVAMVTTSWNPFKARK